MAVIDGISDIIDGQGCIIFIKNKNEWFYMKIKDIEYLKYK